MISNLKEDNLEIEKLGLNIWKNLIRYSNKINPYLNNLLFLITSITSKIYAKQMKVANDMQYV